METGGEGAQEVHLKPYWKHWTMLCANWNTAGAEVNIVNTVGTLWGIIRYYSELCIIVNPVVELFLVPTSRGLCFSG